MKAARFLTAIGIVLSFSATAEPYAEWGVFADGTPLSEIDTSMEIPDSANVPIPLAPGGVFVTNGGYSYCAIEVRTKQSVKQVCDFYKSELDSTIYQQIEPPKIGGSPSCAIFEGGDLESGAGVWVYRNIDPLVSINGSTLVDISYYAPTGKTCND